MAMLNADDNDDDDEDEIVEETESEHGKLSVTNKKDRFARFAYIYK